jgi:hypothetical protein
MISINKQMERINQTYSNWSGLILYRKILKLRGKICPTALSPEYTIEIIYEAGKKPRIYVVEPELIIPPGKDGLPHIWPDSGSLCLYTTEFDYNNDLLAESIIVWVTWWLYYYEIWLETGKWVAKGTHPDKW